MFRMSVAGRDLQDLRAKLFQAARAIEDPQTEPAKVSQFVPPVPPEVAHSVGRAAERFQPESSTSLKAFEDMSKQSAEGPQRTTAEVAQRQFEAKVAKQIAPTLYGSVAPTPIDSEVDSRGIRWDARIHADSKGKLKDGTWRTKRMLDEGLVKSIEQANSVQPTAPAPIPAPPVAAIPFTRPALVTALPPQEPVAVPVTPPIDWKQLQSPQPITMPAEAVTMVPDMTQVPVAAPPQTPSYEQIAVPEAAQKPAHSVDTFRANLVPTFAILIRQNKINQQYVEQLKSYFGLKEIWDIAKDEAKTAELFNNFCAAGLITKVG